jgi:hypothetical protein
MQTLPQTSTWTVKGGLWFIFSHEGNTIRVWGSSLTGKERIYVEDRVVAERRNFKRHGQIDFTIGHKNYAVIFNVVSMGKGQLECILSCGGVPVDAYFAKWVYKPYGKLLLVLIVACIATVTALQVYFPEGLKKVAISLVALVALVALLSVKTGSLSIERIPV